MTTLTKAATDVIAERERQKAVEGWDDAHDDAYSAYQLADAAACYALGTMSPGGHRKWPWDSRWWKPRGYRRNLVKAAALLMAEIERIDRAEIKQ